MLSTSLARLGSYSILVVDERVVPTTGVFIYKILFYRKSGLHQTQLDVLTEFNHAPWKFLRTCRL